MLGASYTPSVQARRVRGGYVLRGRKAFLSMVEGCDYIAMLVHPEEEANPLVGMMLLVPYLTSNQHVEEVWDTLGMRGTRSNNLVLEDCFVPEENFCFRIEDFATWLATTPMWGLGFSYTPVYLGIGAAAYH